MLEFLIRGARIQKQQRLIRLTIGYTRLPRAPIGTASEPSRNLTRNRIEIYSAMIRLNFADRIADLGFFVHLAHAY